MASMNLIVAFLAIVATTVVECKPRPNLTSKKQCPDTLIRNYFDEVRITVNSDWDWISANMKYAAAQKQAAEYAALMELLSKLEAAKRSFDTGYTTVQTEIYERVTGFQSKYGILSISYTERIVTIRKTCRQRLYPELRNFRSLYIQMLSSFNNFYSKYNLDRLVRARALPRAPEYNFAHYFPASPYMGELTGLVQTTWKDYQYIRDLLNRLDYAEGSPDYELKMRLLNSMVDSWIEFNNYRRDLEVLNYPRFLEAGDDTKAIDAIYADYINKLRGYSTRYARNFFDVYGQVEDIYTKGNMPFTSYVDFDLIAAESDIRGLYLPSTRLQKYFTKVIVTTRMDYMTAKRLWDNMKFAEGSPEWQLRKKVLPELKARLDKLELLLNRSIRNAFTKTYSYWDQNPNVVDFDKEYDSVIVEIITASDKDILPTLYEYREQYFVNDDMLADLLKKKGIVDASRNIIPCSTYGYDATIMVPDQDLRQLFRWAEKLMKKNYYGPLNDLIQLRFDDGSDEWKIRRDSIKRLEKIWMDYRNIQNYAIRKYVEIMAKRRLVLGSPEYEREIKAIREYTRPKFVSTIDKFKKDCFDINGYLDQLYAKNSCSTCVRSYSYVETSFEITIKSSTTTRSCSSC